MAEHIWLSQRAERCQSDTAEQGNHKWFALMLRYQSTHDRGFHRCLSELRAIRRERHQERKRQQEFESQNAKVSANVRLTTARAAAIESKTATSSNAQVTQVAEIPVIAIPHGELQNALTSAGKEWARNREREEEKAAA